MSAADDQRLADRARARGIVAQNAANSAHFAQHPAGEPAQPEEPAEHPFGVGPGEVVHDGMPCESRVCLTATHYVCTENRYEDSHHLTPRVNGASACQYCNRTEGDIVAEIQEARA